MLEQTNEHATQGRAKPPLRLAMIGLGTVGTGVARILTENAGRTARRAGRPIELARVCVRDRGKPREVRLPGVPLMTDPVAAASDEGADVVVELMGGTTAAADVVLAALRSGKDVVTANKALIAERGEELFEEARKQGRFIAFEAAVAGGVPVVAALTQALTGNQVTSIEAILNGTSNYILSRMAADQMGYEACVAAAQELGYAEADPTMDVDGTDAAQKLSILTHLAFGSRIPPDAFQKQGIDCLTYADLASAESLGYRVKLLATTRLTEAGTLEMHVQPTLLPEHEPVAKVDGSLNIVALRGDAVGPLWLAGPGAGQMPTASAVVADIVDAASGRAAATFTAIPEGPGGPTLLPAEEVSRRYYLRLTIDDRPSVLARLASVLGENGISIASVIQSEGSGRDQDQVPLVIMTHITTEGQMRAARAKFGYDHVCLPVESGA